MICSEGGVKPTDRKINRPNTQFVKKMATQLIQTVLLLHTITVFTLIASSSALKGETDDCMCLCQENTEKYPQASKSSESSERNQ